MCVGGGGGGGGGDLRECVLGKIITINNNEFLSAPNLTDKAINVTANSTRRTKI